jgi:succinate dehydrogenase hydrophobic anchor subunit
MFVMSAMWMIYLAEVTGKVNQLADGLIFIYAVVLVLCLVFGWMALDILNIQPKEAFDFLKKYFWKIFSPLFIALFLAVFVPATKTIYLMAGAKVTQDVVTSPEAKEISSKIFTIINQKLDESIKPTSKKD